MDATDMVFQAVTINPEHVLWKENNGAVVVMLLATGKFFELNSVGSAVWKLLAQHHAPAEIIQQLTQHYNATTDQLTCDVDTFIRHMLSYGLLDTAH